MASVGERLKLERETRNTTLEEMVLATGIGQSYLDALERGAIDELPGKAFGKLYIRAYAEVFGFDPQPWIDDYDREQRLAQGPSTEPARAAPMGSRPVAEAIARWKAARAAAEKAERAAEAVAPESVPEIAPQIVPEVVAESALEPAPEPEAPAKTRMVRSEAIPTARRFLAPLLLLGVAAIVFAIYLGTRGTSGSGHERSAPVNAPTASSAPRRVEPTPVPRPVETPPRVATKPQPTAPTAAPVVSTASPPDTLTVSEFGVGLRVVNLHLEGESDHFAEGVRVCFASRVLGGRAGDRIRHVWLYEDRVEQSIPLRLGGPDFRTHSNKTLGHAGSWAVEARDDGGRVLARVAFTCGPN
jgi:transcriptional regulator with XRE-family HTH domain